MNAFDTSRLAFQAIRRYPLRTSMMLLSVSIGVAAVVLLTGVGEGARRYVTGEFAALGTHLIIVLPGKSETAGAGGTGTIIGATARDLTLDDAMAIERSARIAQVARVERSEASPDPSWHDRRGACSWCSAGVESPIGRRSYSTPTAVPRAGVPRSELL